MVENSSADIFLQILQQLVIEFPFCKSCLQIEDNGAPAVCSCSSSLLADKKHNIASKAAGSGCPLPIGR